MKQNIDKKVECNKTKTKNHTTYLYNKQNAFTEQVASPNILRECFSRLETQALFQDDKEHTDRKIADEQTVHMATCSMAESLFYWLNIALEWTRTNFNTAASHEIFLN